MIQNNQLLHSLTLRNLLSFGPYTPAIPLGPLNVLIGPNGSGKSNFIEAVALLRATPGDLRAPGSPVIRGGGITEWIWKGEPNLEAAIDAVVSNPSGTQALRHVIAFTAMRQTFHLVDERIENEISYSGQPDAYFYYRFQGGYPVVNVAGVRRGLAHENVQPDMSILAQRKDPDTYPELTYLASAYERIKVYREWTFGRNTIFREPQKADLRNDRLEEDFSNLGLFLNRLRGIPRAKKAILEALRDLYSGLDDFDVSVEGGTVQVFFTEGKDLHRRRRR